MTSPAPEFQKFVTLHVVQLTLAGMGDFQGCGCGFHSGGMGPAGTGPEGAVLGSDAGELPEPSLTR